jgi:hypothetical protein
MCFDSFAKARSYSLSNYPTTEEHLMWLVNKYFLPSVVGKIKYTSQKKCKEISRNVTLSDEAFALLYVANIYDRVIYQCFVQEPEMLTWSDWLPNPLAVVKNKYTEKSQDFLQWISKGGLLKASRFSTGCARILRSLGRQPTVFNWSQPF